MGIDFSARLPDGVPKLFRALQFPIDPVAFAEYRDVVRRAQHSSTLLVRLIPPVYSDRWLAGPVIDCNTPELVEFRRTRENFLDGLHLSADASSRLMSSYVAAELQRILVHSVL